MVLFKTHILSPARFASLAATIVIGATAIPGGLDYKARVAGVKAGRSFVSNGPTIEFTLDGRMAGDVLKVDRPVRLRARGRADSQFPLEKLEVVFNGQVVATGQVAADKQSASIDQEIEVPGSGWMALHAVGPAVAYWAGGPRAAHTNPIYVEMPGRPMDSTADAKYFLTWIDRLEKMIEERDRMHTGREHIESQLSRARAVYRQLLARNTDSP